MVCVSPERKHRIIIRTLHRAAPLRRPRGTMIVSASFHEIGDVQIKAVVEGDDDIAWLDLQLGTEATFHIFMPIERAQRLADAINAAESK